MTAPPTPPIDADDLAPRLDAAFDASVLYAPDNATPTSAAIGYVVWEGVEPHVEVATQVDPFVSSSALEFRALLACVDAIDERFERVESLHLRGDADFVLHAIDEARPETPRGRIERRRVERIRALLADIPRVTYEVVTHHENRRAHELARAGHDWE